MSPIDWSDSATAVDPSQPKTPPQASFVIAVSEGPDAGKRVTLDGQVGARILVGKSPACDLCLTDPQVSRRHAAFEITTQGLRVTDLGSTNGTSVNAVRVNEGFAGASDHVRLGGTTLSVARGDTTPVELPADSGFGRMLGSSDAMRRLYPLCARLAASDVPAVIEGETGTGKEVLSEALHEMGRRSKGPFVVFDCTAVPPNLAESTLFGHERGAFTGAVAARKGVFEEAHGGTLFIDEIGELDLPLQPKLLRAIERGEVQRVGSNQWTKVDVRIISATRRDLDKEVQAGRFRDDLFFRLAVGRIELPPLRDRKGDIPRLALHFWQALGADRPLTRDLIQRFEDYRWPGNVRELHNAVVRVLALGESAMKDTSALAQSLGGDPDVSAEPSGDLIEKVLEAGMPFPRARDAVMDEFSRRYVERVLTQSGGNVVRAAAASGIARRYFQILRARHKGA